MFTLPSVVYVYIYIYIYIYIYTYINIIWKKVKTYLLNMQNFINYALIITL